MRRNKAIKCVDEPSGGAWRTKPAGAGGGSRSAVTSLVHDRAASPPAGDRAITAAFLRTRITKTTAFPIAA